MTTQKHCGVVDSEDGALLFGDASTLQLWRGSDSEPDCIAPMESAFQKGISGLNIPINHNSGVIWDLEGPGTADIFCDETLEKIMIVRCWLADSDEDMEA